MSGIALAVLLLAPAGVALAQAILPDCPDQITAVKTQTYTSAPYKIVVTTSGNRAICNTGGCCDKIVISGLPSGWYVAGWIARYYMFTTKCGPEGDRVIFDGDPMNVKVVSTGAPITIRVCFPKTHDWPTFELHVDLALQVYDAGGVWQQWVGQQPYGVIGPNLDWDPTCYTLGCTPGFWKNHSTAAKNASQYLEWPGEYTPGQYFDSAFACPMGVTLPHVTLLEALNTGGGGEKAVRRLCTAALLNAAYADNNEFPGNCAAFEGATPPVQDVKDKVCAAYGGSRTFNEVAEWCGAMNETLCPYDGVWMNTSDGTCDGVPCNPELR